MKRKKEKKTNMLKKITKNTSVPKDKLSIPYKIRIKLKEIPALFRATKEEKKHIPTFSEIQKEQKGFEKEALSMRKFILRPAKNKKHK